MTLDLSGMHLAGFLGVVFFTWYGAATAIGRCRGWFTDRFEWDRPSWRPWTWRAYRRWYAPGQYVATDDVDHALVLAIDLAADADPIDTWVYVQAFREDADLADPPCWIAVADLFPAAVGPFAEEPAEMPAYFLPAA